MRLATCAVMTMVAIGVATLSGFQSLTPTDWTWRTDTPGRLSDKGDSIAPDQLFFVRMAPGWHITMGPGGVLFPTGREAKGNFTIEASVFLFPGTTQEGYGVFVGARQLVGTGSPSYVAFVARRDGRIAVMKHAAGVATPVVDWKVTESVLPQGGPAADAAKNTFRVDVGAETLTFAVNGKEVAQVPRAGLAVEGAYGFRIGRDVNLHATTFDITERFAPVPIKK